MNLDFKTMSQDKKIKLGILVGMIVTYFLPWFKVNEEGLSPFLFFALVPYYPIFIGLIASVIGLFLALKDDVKFSIFVAAVCLFGAANFYLILIPYDHPMFDFMKQLGIAEWQKMLGYGFYINAALSLGFLFIALKEKGILGQLTKKTSPTVNTGETAPVQNVTPVTPKVKKPPIKISKTTKIIAALVIILAAAGGGYYKFIYTPEYQAYDFIKQNYQQFKVGITPEMRKEHPRMILHNCFVSSIEKVEKKETTTYSEADYNKPHPLYRLYLHPYKKLEDGKIVFFGEYDPTLYTTRKIIQPADLLDEDMSSERMVINVYDEKLLQNLKILPAADLLVLYRPGDAAYYLTDISVKVKYSLEKGSVAEGGAYLDLLEVTEVRNVTSPARSRIEGLFDIDYECLYKSGIIGQAGFYNDSAKCIKQIKPLQDTLEINGGKFIGETMYGKPSGIVVVNWPDSSRFEGEWNGKGIYINVPDSSRYEGDFVDGKVTGKGIDTWPNGCRYEGDHVDEKRSGKGIFTWSNGEKYEGDWVDDKMTGKGVYTNPDGTRYKGDFIDGIRNGKGIITWLNGDKYEGDFVDGFRNGKGIITWSNGEKYEGDFVNGSIGGKGIKYAADGSVIWEH
jgi:hypothetical protein